LLFLGFSKEDNLASLRGCIFVVPVGCIGIAYKSEIANQFMENKLLWLSPDSPDNLVEVTEISDLGS
jgi:hypothetical protein